MQSGQQVMCELGTAFLYVRGDCHAWVSKYAPTELRETRELVLDEVTAAQLAAEMRYNDWPSLAGNWRGAPDVKDGPAVRLFDDAQQIACGSFCDNPSLAGLEKEREGAVREAVAAVYPRIGALYDRAGAMAGGFRVSVVEFPSDNPDAFPLAQPVEWQASVSLASIARPLVGTSFGFGEGVLLSDPEDAAWLRSVRAQYAGGSLGGQSYYFIAVRAPAGLPPYALFLRDALPPESASGLIQPP